MAEVKSVLMVGVGGQGTILASNVLSEGLLKSGYDVKMSEVHGMSQRGGSVNTQIRFGEKVYSPVIEMGAADVIVAFEKMEAVRWLNYLKKGGTVIVNTVEIPPLSVLIGKEEYPKDLLEILKNNAHTIAVEADKIAEGLGNVRAQNIVLLGVLVKHLGLMNIDWEEVIRNNVPKKYIDLNIQAFRKGLEIN
ncbi:indolepyruvate oxidoreductase subunit beta [Caldanaerobacter subterraneus]|uniref:Indolepyruvate oxidoreductase subunit beta n=1 Tax=Caldanaerobacter subterraneus TaxID=911092 RepID=A0A7Y2L7S9_9THEO|nr:indolepyruvate oxidoreductase subunit beta [Caldanaerobacter subterraneus]NNG67247.1 indolepyruvate oxidoreductase subunit beta [Caldanaerobacter subterraneus]